MRPTWPRQSRRSARSRSPPRSPATSSTSPAPPAQSPSLSLGVSPRGATALLATSRAWAWLNGRGFVTPDDVKALAHSTLAHRLSLRPEAELEGVDVGAVLASALGRPVPGDAPAGLAPDAGRRGADRAGPLLLLLGLVPVAIAPGLLTVRLWWLATVASSVSTCCWRSARAGSS